MNQPLITVIVPIYNSIVYLSQCIDSILTQSYKCLEIILVDDGSTDGSGELCDKYADENSAVIVIHQKNKGLVAARKSGLEAAKGDYIGFVDSDDYIDSIMFERLYEEIGSADMIHSGFYENESLNRPPCNKTIELDKYSRNNLIEELLTQGDFGNITPSIWSKLFKRQAIKKIYSKVPDEQSYGEDLLCLVGVYSECSQIKILPEAFYHYSVRRDSMSHNFEDKRMLQEIGLFGSVSLMLRDYGLYKTFENDLIIFLRRQLFHCFKVFFSPAPIQQYYFPRIDEIDGKRIILYGAGDVGRDYHLQILMRSSINLVAWVDKEYYSLGIENVINPERIINYEYDCVLVAVLSQTRLEGIKEDLKSLGVDEKKILWSPPIDILGRLNH